jgi:heat shock protein HslJ
MFQRNKTLANRVKLTMEVYMNASIRFRIGLLFILGLWAFTACTSLFLEKTVTPKPVSTDSVPGSISGTIRTKLDSCGSLWVFAHEVNTDQITNIQTQEGECAYTIPDLPAGNYLVVGWYYPMGASGAYTSQETVMAVGVEEAQACEEAIVTVALKPGQDFSGADIGCWGGDFFDIAASHGQIRLEPNRWKLMKMDDQEVIPETGITLMFEGERFFGSAGCNNYGGIYATAPGGGITLNEIEKTLMLCPEPGGVMEQEDQFLAALIRTKSYITLNLELHLINEEGRAVLTFDLMPKFVDISTEDLVGKTWRLVSAPGLVGVDQGKFTLNFDEQTFSGTTTCRDYAGTYTAENDRLNIGFLEMTTDVVCEESLLVAEGGYTTLLENIDQYNVSDTQLELHTLKGEKLTFEWVAE